MKYEIKPSRASGSIEAPRSKSYAHRLLIAAALSDGVSVIEGITDCEDVLATVDCLRTLGAKIEIKDGKYTVAGTDMTLTAPKMPLCCRESGSTLRFMIPIAALSGAKGAFGGSEKLLQRPLAVYEKLFEQKELLFKKQGDFIFVDGPLTSGEYVLQGDVSSQFISGLLFALPVTNSDSVIKIIPPFESRPYVDLTIDALKKFGINVFFEDEYTIKIPGAQRYSPAKVAVEADYSGAAFIEALNFMGSKTWIDGLNEYSAQGDKVYRELFPALAKEFTKIDISDCPDLAPILFTLAAYCHGAEFTGTDRLKIKESDRASAMQAELSKFGADITVGNNVVTVKKTQLHKPNEMLFGHNDHRIVMSLATLCTVFGGIIDGAEAVAKSYPDFFEDFKKLGIEIRKYD